MDKQSISDTKNDGTMKITYLILLLTVLFSAGCSKQIPGPEGPEGPQGPEGMTGKNGSTILSGTTSPSAGTGKVGDFYLDLSSGTFYGPKAEEGWGKPINLKGEQGAPGNNGTSFIGGESAPTESIGKQGDYYFDKTALAIFGPKTESGWGTPVSLKTPEQNGVKVLLKYNVKFENLVKEPDFIDFEGNVILVQQFNSEITLKPDGLADYIDKGLVFVYIKSGETHWTDYGDSSGSWNWWWENPLFGENEGFELLIREQKIRETGITLSGMLSAWNISPSSHSYPDLNTEEGKQWLSDLLPFDIKIVLVPATSVEYLSATQPAGYDAQQITRFLKF
ncbi:hypothetical protein ACEVG1_13175 [Parapedobacter sp. 2B3]